MHIVLEPGLFAHHPTGTYCGEVAPTVLRSKLGGGIGTQQSLEEILVGVRVIDTSDVAHVATLVAGKGGCLLATVLNAVALTRRILGGLRYLAGEILTFGLAALDREQALNVVLAEVTAILSGEVHLIVVCTGHGA